MHKLLVVVPYRDRASNLEVFIPYITQELQNQKIDYKIVVVEQSPDNLFNRGCLCNIGFHFYNDDIDYVCFHDVDMIGTDIDYSYSSNPCSLIRYRSQNNYKRLYDNYFGGITIFPKGRFKQINGFSNNYWGWGLEDDDLKLRCDTFDIPTDIRSGTCLDLENIDRAIKINNNPRHKNNLYNYYKLKRSEPHLRQKYFLDDGLSKLNEVIISMDTVNHISYTIVKATI